MSRVWHPEHGWGTIISKDETDELVYLIEWEDGTAGWHGAEVRQPVKRTLRVSPDGLYADSFPLYVGQCVLIKHKGKRTTCRLTAIDREWRLEGMGKRLVHSALDGMMIWC